MIKDIRVTLNNSINEVTQDISKYCSNPGKDFTRSRKLDIKTLVKFIMSMQGNSLNKEIYNQFQDLESRMTASALVQQRDKLDPEIFHDILKNFNQTLINPKTYKGLRLYAIDGSDFCTPTNKESKWYIPNHYIRKDGMEAKGTCLLHGNFLFDILNKQYIDVNETRDERDGALQMINNIPNSDNALVIMDRGYTGFNMIENCNRYGGYYIIRSLLKNTIKEIIELPEGPCDKDVSVKVSTKSIQFCELYGYRKMNVRKNKKADYSENTVNTRWDFEEKCTVKFRVCKFQINDPESEKPTWEVLITNLPRDKFDLKEMKHLYHKRWGIETSFRELKYALGAINFHSKKDKFILQELFAHMVMYNAVSRVAALIPIKQTGNNVYVIDFTMSVHIFRDYYSRKINAPPDEMFADLETYRHIIKNGRHNIRVLKPKSAVYFTYRVA